MKVGANSFIWTESFSLNNFDVLQRIAAAELDGIEIGILEPLIFPAKAIRTELQRLGLSSTTCGALPPGSSLIAADREARQRATDHIVATLEATAELGSTLMCGPFFAPVGQFSGVRRTEEEWRRAIEGWQQIAPKAESLGVDVAIEPLNRFETYFLNTAKDGSALCDAIDHPSVGLLVDTFHANIEEKSIGRAIRAAGKHLKHLHTCENDRGIPGTGTVHWQEFFDAVYETKYDGWMVIESFGFNLGILSAAASIWRDVAPKPEDIPFEGAKFIRKQLLRSQA
jgi:D-psicose/D-tagatose/L-ribulose 3-epimerase